ncbi:helix-turn-helix domain-containing protein [Methylobacterium sp. E-025]|uniref:helix-turn-helix domain-containing protein n=1 Tax=Methylobacterium sp. E-025 TaxID=2836561 RepID=UPI001FB8835F|nr:helix-turn-helix domain-containing protein [Methylobacterium sp. E-025]MCJ2110496.1 helix-turn-helix domain-containing protein [Methylobacterium sp. E-025]
MTTPPPTAEIIPLVLPPQEKRKADDKYGKAVMGHGFTILPKLLFETQAHLKISPTAFNVLLHLIYHWWDANDAPRPAIATVARRMGKSPRSLFRYFDELEAAGLLERVHRYKGKKKQTASAYVLTGLIEKLQKIEPQMTAAKKFKGKRLVDAETPAKASTSAA